MYMMPTHYNKNNVELETAKAQFPVHTDHLLKPNYNNEKIQYHIDVLVKSESLVTIFRGQGLGNGHLKIN